MRIVSSLLVSFIMSSLWYGVGDALLSWVFLIVRSADLSFLEPYVHWLGVYSLSYECQCLYSEVSVPIPIF